MYVFVYVLLQVVTATTLCIGVLENHDHVFGDLLVLNTLFSDFRFLTLNQIFVLFNKSVRVPSSVSWLGDSHLGETNNLFIDDCRDLYDLRFTKCCVYIQPHKNDHLAVYF